MHEEEETYTYANAKIEEHPSSPVVGEVITPMGGILVVVQDVPKTYEGMHMFPFSVTSSHHMEDCGNVPLHDLGSKYIADLE